MRETIIRIDCWATFQANHSQVMLSILSVAGTSYGPSAVADFTVELTCVVFIAMATVWKRLAYFVCQCMQ